MSHLLAALGLRDAGKFKEFVPNQALHLTGAAIPVSQGSTLLEAAPAGELGRWAESSASVTIPKLHHAILGVDGPVGTRARTGTPHAA
jgi:hypothetical protein